MGNLPTWSKFILLAIGVILICWLVYFWDKKDGYGWFKSKSRTGK
jgi:hypothetical protein